MAFKDIDKLRPDDFWQIPARTLIGGVIWPSDHGARRFLPPRFTRHDFAPLALITKDGGSLKVTDMRRVFDPIQDVARPK